MAVREILFRGRRVDNGDWVEGDLFNNYDERIFVGELIVNDYTGNAHDDYELGVGFYEVDPETVGQWTGLVDKYGTKIFEGDVIRCSILYGIGCYPHMGIETRVVTYKDGRFNPLCYCECNNYEVIGNIHDNPELVN